MTSKKRTTDTGRPGPGRPARSEPMERKHVMLPKRLMAVADGYPGGASKFIRIAMAAAAEPVDLLQFLESLPYAQHAPDYAGRPCLCSQCLQRKILERMRDAARKENLS